jgi:hypothetical protein
MSPQEDPVRPNLIDQVADLLQMASDWVRQEAESFFRNKMLIPLQKVGITVASAQAAGCLLVMGMIFLEVGVIMLMGQWLGYPVTFLIIGGVLLLGSAVFLGIKMRMMQR